MADVLYRDIASLLKWPRDIAIQVGIARIRVFYAGRRPDATLEAASAKRFASLIEAN
ncbi:hypothetical protein [Burkholderia sp. AU15512]|uniref:hypothetical protein n=1 Tax=Burkholderia sp. AU15512 TaxID=2015345 RepID=UPI0015C68D90|nr:hypothetical protein [Burkholderia sp. AU15512]